MKKLFKNYKSTIILLGSVILGGIIGIVMGPKSSVLEPFGKLFINLMFMILVPLVFFSVSSAMANISGMKRLGKIMGSIVLVFLSTALIAAIIGTIATLIMKPTSGLHIDMFKSLMKSAVGTQTIEKVSFLDQLVNTFTVSDFVDLLSRKNMLQLVVFSIIFGISVSLSGEKAKSLARLLEAGSITMMNVVKIIMYYAPIGLGCYFASMVGQLGGQILNGYLKIFVLYLIISVIYYFGFFSLYAFVAAGKNGVRIFWENAVTPSVTALATCSSAACIPANLETVKKIGVPYDIAETVIPLGANMHKDGSVFGGVMKITLLMGLFGKDMTSVSSILGIIGVSLLVGAVMGAIPSGGMIGEMLILSVYGLPPEVLPIIAVVSVIIDAPATLLNSTGNTVCSMLVTRLVEGKNWLKHNKKIAS
ncbi:dicarboxylate/amino acid:cation symporter [Clostridium estertheticum]|uniref:Sodium:proton antiporter n=1 Tax=Clostridium estertheticum subsp. estertheticum TaxID=1552 RepID=A0A1J0GEN6_9CLOT|nr:dicarboxylate/amino acid:cation symporter [Clostridium estertheticum]APC39828.1 sodium:proton antiporter [Clostridium estertheticum subsp. estertheticum]MBU3172006.1 dicarboxylate/amino acid:cation symporter [Clostridium estertheticum]MBU3185001.1 dicarboxylate/amino acid:cation symporter [Clostridium estertheticum]MBZ9614120.1 dicarboxylate/amino acid:cation symporter [Clostridium estertheticum subsp. laramiense]WAG74069.1 dicarboxylate/amino acid:cation symporter [Clostridium estertheticu